MTEMRYARAGDSHIGYTIVEGDSDLDHTMMFAVGNNYPFELMLDDPIIRRFIDGLAALGRVVLFDRRGIGCSDGIEDWETPLVEQWADDISAVVEDARLEAVTIFADLSGAALVWAARRPEELDRLILWNHASETRSSGRSATVSMRALMLRAAIFRSLAHQGKRPHLKVPSILCSSYSATA